MRPRTGFLLAVFFLLLASSAHAGTIRGTVTSNAKKAKKGRASVTDAVVYIDQLPPEVERKLNSHGFWFFRKESPPRVRNLVLMNRRFDPYVLAIALNDRIAFQNLDRVYHSAFSVSAAKRFDLNRRAPGASDTLTMSRPGVINLHCEIHPDMGGYVVVLPNHAFTFPNEKGQFRLPSLPPGGYTVRVFHPRWGEIQRRVQLDKSGDATVDLAY
jgi:hypothetical protein